MTARWTRRPTGSNWGDYGADDRLGRLNLITPARRRAAAAQVKEGIAFCLSLPLHIGPRLNPSRFPPRLHPTVRNGKPRLNACAGEEARGATDVVCDDAVLLYSQFSTQWDGLCHAGALFDVDDDGHDEIVYYNGYPAAWNIGANELGIEHMAVTGVQGRGVLVDLEAYFGPGRTTVGFEQWMRCLESTGVCVEPGDILCVHTGFAEYLLSHEAVLSAELAHVGAVLDGRDQELLEWISTSGISALVADNVAIEERRSALATGEVGPLLPLHEHCLFKLGLHLGELWHLTPLARWLRAHDRAHFFLTAPPLRLRGAAGSAVTPVATV